MPYRGTPLRVIRGLRRGSRATDIFNVDISLFSGLNASRRCLTMGCEGCAHCVISDAHSPNLLFDRQVEYRHGSVLIDGGAMLFGHTVDDEQIAAAIGTCAVMRGDACVFEEASYLPDNYLTDAALSASFQPLAGIALRRE